MKPIDFLALQRLHTAVEIGLRQLGLGDPHTISPPAAGPSAMLNLLLSRKRVMSAALACGWKRMSAKEPSGSPFPERMPSGIPRSAP